MGNDAALADEAPLTLRSFPYWALFIVIFGVVTVVGSVLVAVANLLSAAGAIAERVQLRERTRPDARKHLQVIPPARP